MRYAPKKVSAELYAILRQACTGDALTCIRAVHDMRSHFVGKTMAEAICSVGAVTYPQKVKELKARGSRLGQVEGAGSGA